MYACIVETLEFARWYFEEVGLTMLNETEYEMAGWS